MCSLGVPQQSHGCVTDGLMCAVLLTMVKAGGACSDVLVHAAFAGVLLVDRPPAGAPEGRLLHAIVIQGCQAGVALPGDSDVVPVVIRPESEALSSALLSQHSRQASLPPHADHRAVRSAQTSEGLPSTDTWGQAYTS